MKRPNTEKPMNSPAGLTEAVIPAQNLLLTSLFFRRANRVFHGLGLLILLSAALSLGANAQMTQKTGAAAEPTHDEQAGARGNEVCAKCHGGIAEKYAGTAMARASGPATQDFMAGEFTHAASGMHYRVYEENDEAWLSFERSGENELHGKRKLQYFIGSGHRGRTYLFADDGFVFESPINFYAAKGAGGDGVWDMAPAYQDAKEMPLSLPAAPSCLACHTSNALAPMAGTENRYGTPLFAHDGVTCERCHGAGLEHVKQAQEGPAKSAQINAGAKSGTRSKGPPSANAAPEARTATIVAAGAGIVNPAKLAPARRDAVCMQCHLEGNAAIEQPGRHLYQFQAGEDLGDFVHYFVLTGDGKDSVRAVSQFEALAQSKCKRASGDAMMCTSCHDPHSSPTAAERVAFYRGKCLACHGEAFGAKHHVEQQDCAQCHMPRLATADVAHTQASDHRIMRVPVMPLLGVGSPFDPSHGPPREPKLTRFPTGLGEESVRDLALAWVGLGGGNSSFAFKQAGVFLQQAVEQNPEDAAILSALAYNEQRRGVLDKAREHYEHALRIDPLLVDAAANLGVMEANAGHFDKAIALWKPAFERAPERSSLGLNLARGLCLSGRADEVRATITRMLEFNPDSGAGRGMLKQLESGEVKCVVH